MNLFFSWYLSRIWPTSFILHVNPNFLIQSCNILSLIYLISSSVSKVIKHKINSLGFTNDDGNILSDFICPNSLLYTLYMCSSSCINYTTMVLFFFFKWLSSDIRFLSCHLTINPIRLFEINVMLVYTPKILSF